MQEEQNKSIFFVSDLHLGAPNREESIIREKHFIKWLNEIAPRASDIYLLGDIFDFWFEYKKAVPKRFVRLLGRLADLSDQGIRLHIFIGNHDLWYKDYFTEEIGINVYRKPITQTFFGKQFYFAHGDGLGPGDHGYKLLRKVFTNPLCKWAFARLHPNFGIGLAQYFSRSSWEKNKKKTVKYFGEKEFLYIHSRNILENQPDIQYFIYGHRHLAINEEIAPDVNCIFLGDWIKYFSYLEITKDDVQLCKYPI